MGLRRRREQVARAAAFAGGPKLRRRSIAAVLGLGALVLALILPGEHGGTGPRTSSTSTTAPSSTSTTAPSSTSTTAPSSTSTASNGASTPTQPVTPAVIGTVVGLGDSVPAGSGCGCTPFVELLGQTLAARSGSRVEVQNEAVGGLTSAQLLGQLSTNRIRTELTRARVVVVTVGANDFDSDPDRLTGPSCRKVTSSTCYGPELSDLSDAIARIVDVLDRLVPEGGRILVTGYWNVFLDGDLGAQQGQTYGERSKQLTQAVNAVVASDTRGRRPSYTDLYGPFEDHGAARLNRLLADDGDHPSAAGHRLIAAALLAELG